jgi:tripeptidyl-peptidase-1
LFVRGKQTVLSGTSAATPLWGAIITRINEERLAAGKSTVGFINPVLYKNADAMTDIIGGENDGCDFQGFPAVKG